MLKLCIINYFKSFKYIFTPLGTMFLGLLLGLSVLIPGTIVALDSLINEVKELGEGVNLDFGKLWEQLREAITALNWDNPGDAFQIMLSSEWINEVIMESLNLILGSDFSMFSEQLQRIIDTFVSSMGTLFFILIFFFIIGFIIGFILTRFFIRRNIAKRTLWKWFLSVLINAALSVGMVFGVIIFYSFWKPSAVFSALLLLIIQSVLSLIGAYYLYAYKKVKLTNVLNIKNTGFYLLGNTLILILSIIFSLIALLINGMMGAFVALAIFEILLCVMTMNAESYVQNLMKKMGFNPLNSEKNA